MMAIPEAGGGMVNVYGRPQTEDHELEGRRPRRPLRMRRWTAKPILKNSVV